MYVPLHLNSPLFYLQNKSTRARGLRRRILHNACVSSRRPSIICVYSDSLCLQYNIHVIYTQTLFESYNKLRRRYSCFRACGIVYRHISCWHDFLPGWFFTRGLKKKTLVRVCAVAMVFAARRESLICVHMYRYIRSMRAKVIHIKQLLKVY